MPTPWPSEENMSDHCWGNKSTALSLPQAKFLSKNPADDREGLDEFDRRDSIWDHRGHIGKPGACPRIEVIVLLRFRFTNLVVSYTV